MSSKADIRSNEGPVASPKYLQMDQRAEAAGVIRLNRDLESQVSFQVASTTGLAPHAI